MFCNIFLRKYLNKCNIVCFCLTVLLCIYLTLIKYDVFSFQSIDIIEPARVIRFKSVSSVIKYKAVYTNASSIDINKKYLTVVWDGRLGNNMFQYASAQGIAAVTGRIFISAERDTLVTYKNLNANMLLKQNDLYSRFSTNEIYTHQEDWLDGQTYMTSLIQKVKDSTAKVFVLSGFFQSYKYFHNLPINIPQQFVFNDAIQSKVRPILKKYRENDAVVIGVHVRIGDMKQRQAFVEFGYLVADENYVKRAMDYFQKKFAPRRVNFLVTAAPNEIPWVKQHLKTNGFNVHILDGNTPGEDMCFLAYSDHVIMTVGSYGWWAGYLNNKTVTYQKDRARPGSTYFKICNHIPDYFPPNFIPL